MKNEHLDSFTPGQPPTKTHAGNRTFAEGFGASPLVAAKHFGPMKDDIAVCSQGYLGLITSDGPQTITYPDGNTGEAFTGIHLSPGMYGSPWSSRNPTVLTSLKAIAAKAPHIALIGIERGTLLNTVHAECGNGFGQEAEQNVTQGVGVGVHGYETPATRPTFRRSCI